MRTCEDERADIVAWLRKTITFRERHGKRNEATALLRITANGIENGRHLTRGEE